MEFFAFGLFWKKKREKVPVLCLSADMLLHLKLSMIISAQGWIISTGNFCELPGQASRCNCSSPSGQASTGPPPEQQPKQKIAVAAHIPSSLPQQACWTHKNGCKMGCYRENSCTFAFSNKLCIQLNSTICIHMHMNSFIWIHGSALSSPIWVAKTYEFILVQMRAS